MCIGCAERVFQQRLILIWEEAKQRLEIALLDRIGEWFREMPTADEQEDDA
jgi:hypothetical protein